MTAAKRAASALPSAKSSPVRPGPRHWRVFTDLCRAVNAAGNRVPDAFHAALAIEAEAVFVSADRAHARFPGLKYRHPLDAEAGG